jgi:hypothetical protein
MGPQRQNPAARLLCWVLRRPGYMLVTATEDRLAAEPPERFAHAWLGTMGLSFFWGLVMWNVWAWAWGLFRDYDPLIMPALATAALFSLWAYRRGLIALAELLGGRDGTARAVAATMLVLVLGLAMARLGPDWDRLEVRLPVWIEWLRPAAKLYRVLLLMPVWGGWAMLITVKFARPGETTEPQVASYARGCGALAAAGCMAPPLGLSMVYLHHLGLGSQVGIPLATILTAVFGGLGLCRRAGGLRRAPLLAVNVLTQMAFLVVYLAGR